jgi:hypothetical protein
MTGYLGFLRSGSSALVCAESFGLSSGHTGWSWPPTAWEACCSAAAAVAGRPCGTAAHR